MHGDWTMKKILTVVAINVLLLALLVLPLWFALAWLTTTVFLREPNHDTGSAFLMGYVSLVLPLVLVVIGQQVAFVIGTAILPRLRNRKFALVTVALIPLGLAPISAPLDVQFAAPFAAATILSLLFFGMLMRLS